MRANALGDLRAFSFGWKRGVGFAQPKYQQRAFHLPVQETSPFTDEFQNSGYLLQWLQGLFIFFKNIHNNWMRLPYCGFCKKQHLFFQLHKERYGDKADHSCLIVFCSQFHCSLQDTPSPWNAAMQLPTFLSPCIKGLCKSKCFIFSLLGLHTSVWN